MECVILAGGLGTRLRSAVSNLPKSMAPVAGKPFLEYLICWLRRQEIRRIILSTGYLADSIEGYFLDGSRWNVDIAYSREIEPLGTGGAIRAAGAMVSGNDFIVMNGDSCVQLELCELIPYHVSKHSIGTLALISSETVGRYGGVELSEDGRITRFSEKGTSHAGLISAGVYVVHRDFLRLIPEGTCSVERDVFPALVGKGLYGMPVSGFFIDIGVPRDYEYIEANARRFVHAMGIEGEVSSLC